MTQSWQQMAEERLRLYGFGLAEFNRIEQQLRKEQDRLSLELEALNQELVVLAHQGSDLFHEKAKEIQRTELRRRITRVGLEVAVAYGQGQTGCTLLARLLDTALEATGAETVAVFTLRDETLKLTAAKGLYAEAFAQTVALRLGEGLSGVAAERSEPIVTTEPSECSQLVRFEEGPVDFGWFATVPLLGGGGLVGTMYLLSTSPLPVAAPELQVLTWLGSLVRASLVRCEEKGGPERLLPPT